MTTREQHAPGTAGGMWSAVPGFVRTRESFLRTLADHWPEYVIEAVGLAWVMLAAGVIASLLWYGRSPLHSVIATDPLRRAVMGIGMASAVAAFVYSPFGKRSGAHINPAITLAFLYLRKISAEDAFFYVAAQFIGGALGVALFAALAGPWASDPAVNYIVTAPGEAGIVAAFVAELVTTFAMMLLVLVATNDRRLHRFTGILVSVLLAALIAFESPVSGTSLNPARSFGSALVARHFTAIWIYFTAPPLGAWLAALPTRRAQAFRSSAQSSITRRRRPRCATASSAARTARSSRSPRRGARGAKHDDAL